MGAAAGACLKDDGATCRLGRAGVGHRILPSQDDKARDGGAVGQTGGKDIAQGGKGHLNLAIMSLMPGIFSIWSAWLGWKYWTSERCVSPARMVK